MVRYHLFFPLFLLLSLLPACKEQGASGAGQPAPGAALPGNKRVVAVPVRNAELLDDSVSFFRYSMQDTIREDLNCDGIADLVYFGQHSNGRSLVFFNGRSSEAKRFGRELPVGKGLGEDFGWVHFWGLTRDTATWEALIEDGEILGSTTTVLRCPSILLRSAEAGGGIITFRDNGFQWVHQAD
jgi:hypothetical protein